MIIFLIIVIICLSVLCIYSFTNRKQINEEIEKNNNELIKNHQILSEQLELLKSQENEHRKQIQTVNLELSEKNKEMNSLNCEYATLNGKINGLHEQERQVNERIAELGKTAEELVKSQKELAAATIQEIKDNLRKDSDKLKADFNKFSLELESRKGGLEATYNEYEALLQDAYSKKQQSLIKDTNEIKNELAEAKQARSALIEAARREKEIKENSSFYCVEISDTDKADIAKLESVAKTLNNPRTLHMLIWQTYYSKPLKALTANLLGNKVGVTGIYKITNTITGECYIGQSVSLADRWVQHMKAALGIDTPAGNKLYKAMQEYGAYNFAFECLEECERDKLDERERYYIDFYDSYNFGYNSNRGNK